MREKSEYCEPVVYGHQDHAATRETLAIEAIPRCSARVVAAAVKPDHHRLTRADRPFRIPYVHEQAVFAARFLHPAAGVLRTRCAESLRFTRTGPGFDRRGLAPAKIANGSLCEWNALESRSTLVECDAANLSAG